MIRLTSLLLAALLASCAGSPDASGIVAASCSAEDVQAAIDAAVDGDTVRVPAGTCTWERTVTLGEQQWTTAPPTYVSKAITIRGAGVGRTVILDGVLPTDGGGPLLSLVTAAGKPVRLTGFTFRTSPRLTDMGVRKITAVIHVSGDGEAFRIDHNGLDTDPASGRGIMPTGAVLGVIDHNTFGPGVGQAVAVSHDGWGGQSAGHGSWAAPLAFGTEQAVYIEDNEIRSDIVTDGYFGARFVVRHNAIATARTPIQNHGAEASDPGSRSTFSMEVYENTIELPELGTMLYLRGGTAVIHDNVITGPPGLPPTLGHLLSFRSWASCDGTGLYDLNDRTDGPETPGGAGDGVFEAGTHGGAAFVETAEMPSTLTAGGGWTEDQWVGYSLRNVTKGWGSEIESSTATTLTTAPNVHLGNPSVTQHDWDPGDVFEIRRVESCMDQIGRSTGVLLTGAPVPYGSGVVPVGWPEQSLEPMYTWGNTINGEPHDGLSSRARVIREGRDYVVGSPRPGYETFRYPHPLATPD